MEENNAPKKEPYMTFDPPQTPTQETSVEGLRFDFNMGLRVSVPEGNYRVRFTDRDAALTVYDAKASGVVATSTKRYFVNFRLEVYEDPSKEEQKAAKAKEKTIEAKLVFSHDYDANGKKVLMKFAGAAMGDLLAWFPYAEAFRKKHGCELYAWMDKRYIEILRAGYPDIHFLAPDDKRPDDLYATYYVGLFAPWDDRNLQPTDWRVVGRARGDAPEASALGGGKKNTPEGAIRLHRDAGHGAMQILEQRAGLDGHGRLPEGARLPGALRGPGPGDGERDSRQRDSLRRGGFHRKLVAAGARRPDFRRGIFRRANQRTVVDGVGRGRARGVHFRLYRAGHGVLHPVPRAAVPHLPQLRQRPAQRTRLRRLRRLPAPPEHRPRIRMHKVHLARGRAKSYCPVTERNKKAFPLRGRLFPAPVH